MRILNYKGNTEYSLNFFRPYKTDARISSPFGPRDKHFHKGCDYVGIDKNVRAVGRTKVIRTGFQKKGAGNYIVLESLWYKMPIIIKYFHLNKVFVRKGDIVNATDVIGIEGSTGRSSGSHLHLEICVDGIHINPEDTSIVKWLSH